VRVGSYYHGAEFDEIVVIVDLTPNIFFVDILGTMKSIAFFMILFQELLPSVTGINRRWFRFVIMSWLYKLHGLFSGKRYTTKVSSE
jgi:hypothetical protein